MLTAQFTMSDNTFQYAFLSVVPVSANWKQATATIVPPAGAVGMSIFHSLTSAGSLTLDDVRVSTDDINPEPTPTPAPTVNPTPTDSPAPTPPATDNLVKNPSFETGSTSPTNWGQGGFGTNDRTFTYPAEGRTGAKGAKVEITTYTDGDAKWFFDDVSVTEGTTYTYSNYYKSDVLTTLTAQFTMSDDTFQFAYIADVPASPTTWAQASGVIVPPAGAVGMSIFHSLISTGSLTVDDVSVTGEDSGGGSPLSKGLVTFTFDDGWNSHYVTAAPMLEASGMRGSFGIITDTMATAPTYANPSQIDVSQYMNPTYITELFRRGHEIGSHTRTHPDLTTLSAADLRSQVFDSKQALIDIGINPVETFIYPFGAYNANVIRSVKDAGYIGARTVNRGYNTAATDPFVLFEQEIQSTTTFAEVQGWIDTAVANDQWLVLTFHQIDNSGSQYGNTPELLQQIIDYVATANVDVVTLGDGIRR